MQGVQARYIVDPSERRCSGSFSQLLTGNTSGSMVFVPYKKPSNSASADKMPCGSHAMYADNEQPVPTAPEPYEILMPVQMADGRMLPMPSGQPKVRWSCCLLATTQGVLHRQSVKLLTAALLHCKYCLQILSRPQRHHSAIFLTFSANYIQNIEEDKSHIIWLHLSVDCSMPVAVMQDAFAPGTLFVPRQHSAAHLDLANAPAEHLTVYDQQLHDTHSDQHYMQTDSALFQHYADMGPAQDSLTTMLATDMHLTPSASFPLEPSMTGMQASQVLLPQMLLSQNYCPAVCGSSSCCCWL